MIHLIGDSHVWHLNKLFQSRDYYMGSLTAYNLSKREDWLLSIIGKIPPKEPIMMVFGEIDCRVHLIHQSIIQNRKISDVVEECCERYLKVIRKVRKPVYVWGMIPSQKDSNPLDLVCPRYGSKEDRDLVSKMFNSYLKDKCKLIDFFDLITPDMYLKDGVHLSLKAKPLFDGFSLSSG